MHVFPGRDTRSGAMPPSSGSPLSWPRCMQHSRQHAWGLAALIATPVGLALCACFTIGHGSGPTMTACSDVLLLPACTGLSGAAVCARPCADCTHASPRARCLHSHTAWHAAPGLPGGPAGGQGLQSTAAARGMIRPLIRCRVLLAHGPPFLVVSCCVRQDAVRPRLLALWRVCGTHCRGWFWQGPGGGAGNNCVCVQCM